MLSDTVQVAVIAAFPALFSAILGLFNHNKISSMKIQLDGRLQELLTAQNSKGRIEERTEQRKLDEDVK